MAVKIRWKVPYESVSYTEIDYNKITVYASNDVKVVFRKKGYENTILHLSTTDARKLSDLLTRAAYEVENE